MYIGDVYVPIVSEFSAERRKKENKVLKPLNTSEPILVPMRKDLRELTIKGILIPESPKTEDNFAEDLLALIRDPSYNHVSYADKDGFVAAETIETPKLAEMVNAREFTIDGYFLPRSVYERVYKFNQEIIVNDFGIGFPAVIPLPVGAYNVKLKSPWQTVNISSAWASISGKDGDIPFYRPFPLFDQDNYNSTTGDITYLEEAYRLQTINLDAQGEYAQWTVGIGTNIPKGTYKIALRVRDDNVANDIKVTVSGSVSGTILTETLSTGGTSFVLLETSEFNALTEETLTIKVEKALTDANVIEIDYCYIDPTYVARLAFDVDSEVNVGEVKVWDTMGSSDETQWVRVYNKEHRFVGNIVVENGVWRYDFGGKQITEKVWDGVQWLTSGTLYWWSGSGYYNYDKAWIESITSDDVVMTIQYIRDTDSNTFTVPFYFAKHYFNHASWSPNPKTIKAWITNGSWVVSHFEGGSSVADGLYLLLSPTTSFVNTLISNTTIGFYRTSGGGWGAGPVTNSYAIYNSGFSNLFKEAEDAILSSASDPLSYSDDFSSDTSARYADYTGGWTWDTVNGELDAYSDTEGQTILRLRSLKFGSGTYSVDVRLNSTNAVYRRGGLLFGAQDDQNYYWAYLQIDDIGNGSVVLWKFVDNTAYGIGSAAIALNTNTWYTIKVEWDPSTSSIKVYVDDVLQIDATDGEFSSGNIGFKAYASPAGAGNLDVSFDNLSISATEVTNRGAQVNRYLDDFDWDSSAEYTQSEGTWTWDDINGIVSMNDGAARGTMYVNALKFGNGTYKAKVKATASGATTEAGIIFGFQDANNYYLVDIYRDDVGGVGKVVVYLRENGTWNTLASYAATIDLNKWYELEVEWDPSTGSIKPYLDGSLLGTATDTNTTFSNGYSGLFVNAAGTASFDDLEIQAEEVTSSGNTCVIIGGINHGGIPYTWDGINYVLNPGTDIPLGRYLVVYRVKNTYYKKQSLYVRNLTDVSSIDMDGYGKDLYLSQTYSNYTYLIRPIKLDEDDKGDDIYITVRESDAWNYINPAIAVDYFLLIPISLLESSQLGPQDIAFLSMVDSNLKRVLEVKS